MLSNCIIELISYTLYMYDFIYCTNFGKELIVQIFIYENPLKRTKRNGILIQHYITRWC